MGWTPHVDVSHSFCFIKMGWNTHFDVSHFVPVLTLSCFLWGVLALSVLGYNFYSTLEECYLNKCYLYVISNL